MCDASLVIGVLTLWLWSPPPHAEPGGGGRGAPSQGSQHQLYSQVGRAGTQAGGRWAGLGGRPTPSPLAAPLEGLQELVISIDCCLLHCAVAVHPDRQAL